VSSTELNVVCRNCGEEVSPYVTECPYCGTRIRKRAPKLERRGDELTAREPRRQRRRRARQARQAREDVFPYASLAVVIASTLVLLTLRALGEFPTYLGAIVGDVGSEWWRYFAAPFVYENVGYLFVIGCGVMIFGPPVERRLGTIATALLIVATGTLGMLAATGIETALDSSEPLVAAGGNGIALGLLCAFVIMRRSEGRTEYDEGMDVIGVAVAATVLVLLPVFADWANVFAGLGGAAVGAACGLAASMARRPRSPAG
jgi:membrane associated rhomboid family serine protease